MSKSPSPPLAHLLIVDDEENQMLALRETLRDQGYETTGFTSAAAAIAAVGTRPFELLLTDLTMPEMSGIALLERALQRDPELVGIVMTGQGSIDTAVQAMKAGALDYILKPFRLSVILPVLARALAIRQLRLDKATLEARVRERTAALEAANQELESFSYSVSHDLRAPLRHVRSYLQLLKTDESSSLGPEGRQCLDNASDAAARMETLINDLLEFARMGRGELRWQPFSGNDLVQEVIGELKQESASRAIQWQIGPLPEATADRALLKQVWTNLLANALKYTRQRDPAIIEIGCHEGPAEFEFYVRDNGAGFDTRFADRLFGVFQRLHSSQEFEGTGVGLASVRRIITRHGGKTRADGKLGAGATFWFTLPRSHPAKASISAAGLNPPI